MLSSAGQRQNVSIKFKHLLKNIHTRYSVVFYCRYQHVYTWTQFILVCFMVFNSNFNNIPAISWRSVLLVEETRGPGKNHRPVASHWQTLSHNVVRLALIGMRTQFAALHVRWYKTIRVYIKVWPDNSELTKNDFSGMPFMDIYDSTNSLIVLCYVFLLNHYLYYFWQFISGQNIK
jgi:hypothetical protein